MKRLFLSVLGLVVGGFPCLAKAGPVTIRVGHFPNITHAQALVAHQLSRQNKGWFEARLGQDVKVEWFVYNAGPSAMEAIFARSIDMTYVGPNPAINAHLRSRSAEIRIVAGAMNGGAALVVPKNSTLSKPEDFRGKKIATPQLGNTQDIACRAWLANGGLKISQMGGDAFVIPTPNPDQLSLFKQNKFDAIWTIEPWVSRLLLEANGKILVEDSNVITTWLAARSKFLQENRELVKKWTKAQAELTQWILDNPEEAQKLITQELKEETRADFPAELMKQAWPRIHLTNEISKDALNLSVEQAKKSGFLRGSSDVSKLIEIP